MLLLICTIEYLQDEFWADPAVSNSTTKRTIYLDNLGKYMDLRAVELNIALELIERLSDSTSINEDYEDIMKQNGLPDYDDEDDGMEIVAPLNCM